MPRGGGHMSRQAQNEKKQRDILSFIYNYLEAKNYSPSIREIQAGLLIKSPATVHKHLNELVKKGFLAKDQGEDNSLRRKSRNVTVTASGASFLGRGLNRNHIPLLTEEITSPVIELGDKSGRTYFPIPPNLDRTDPLFMVALADDAMLDAHLLKDDLVIVRKQENFKDGDIVLVLGPQNLLTCRRYRYKSEKVHLVAENPTANGYYLEEIPPILGKVLSVYRIL
ncbi:hypothetical protein FC36_GL000561 [Ligilactobacillus equi DSM 15833 = JCM 10991]|uniref:LexA repressor n=3 Tax=Ligilactobacillus equi TaxID=137357 RepID=V7HZU8_9LACO|nr:LexA repressor [Ligilactobacillus equi DPC 6820]KRL85191.1 hypothetical protein FC36_GL000561 [Ligilactobacillus equi DSM 15833 = JCM 10991]